MTVQKEKASETTTDPLTENMLEIAASRAETINVLRLANERLARENERLQAAINEAYRIMCSGTPPHSARETNARRVLRLAGVTVKEQSV